MFWFWCSIPGVPWKAFLWNHRRHCLSFDHIVTQLLLQCATFPRNHHRLHHHHYHHHHHHHHIDIFINENTQVCYLPLTSLLLKPLHRVLHYQLLLERKTIYHLLKSVMLSPLSATYLRILILILILLKNFFITPSSREHLRSVSSSAEFLFLNHFKLVSSNFHIHRGSSYFGNFVTFQEGDVWMYNLHNNQSHFVISIKISQFRAEERWKEWGFFAPRPLEPLRSRTSWLHWHQYGSQ